MNLDGKTALVTGAGRGIGKAIAIAFAREGCDVALTARSEPELLETARAIEALGRRTATIAADLSDSGQVASVARAAEDALGHVDILVNNAGYASFKPFLELTEEELRLTLDVNLAAPFLLTQALAPAMIERQSGRIINISSVAGLKPIPKQSAYCASKHGLNGLSKVLAMELQEHGIAVHWVCPGGVVTKLSEEAMPERKKTDWMEPEDIARICVFLAGMSHRATIDEVMVRRFDSKPLGG